MKKMQRYSYLLNWIPAGEKPKLHKNQYCDSLCYNQWKNGCLKESNEKKIFDASCYWWKQKQTGNIWRNVD